MKLNEINERMLAIAEEMEALGQKDPAELTEEEVARGPVLEEELGPLRAQAAQLQRAAEVRAELEKSAGDPRIIRRSEDRGAPGEQPEADGSEAPVTVPARLFRYSSLKAFKGPDADRRAYRFGLWCAAACGAPWALAAIRKHGIKLVRALGEDVNTAGGVLVPPEFDIDIIELMETYGAFRRNARIVPMASDVKSVPRRTGGITAYFVGESEAGTESDKTWDQVNLIARKLMCLTKYSSELAEDAVINVGDDLAEEFARANAYKEDLCGFIGDGSMTYGGMTGVATRLTNVNGVDEGGGVIVGTGDVPSELLLADFNKVIGILPQYADLDAKWYCTRTVWATSMQRLEAAAGGNAIPDIINGARVQRFLGYPVEIVQVMASGSAVSQVLAIFGDLRLAARMGVRRGFSISFSSSALNAFEKDEVVVRGLQRFDINVHDVGTATVAGPVVALVGKSA